MGTMSPEDMAREIVKWRQASRRAGQLLKNWHGRHRTMVDTFLPLVPVIAEALESANIDAVEALLQRAK